MSRAEALRSVLKCSSDVDFVKAQPECGAPTVAGAGVTERVHRLRGNTEATVQMSLPQDSAGPKWDSQVNVGGNAGDEVSIQEQVRVILLETYNAALGQIKAHTVTGGPVLAYAQ